MVEVRKKRQMKKRAKNA